MPPMKYSQSIQLLQLKPSQYLLQEETDDATGTPQSINNRYYIAFTTHSGK